MTIKLGSWKIRKTLFTQRSHVTKQQENSCQDINLLDFNTMQFYEQIPTFSPVRQHGIKAQKTNASVHTTTKTFNLQSHVPIF